MIKLAKRPGNMLTVITFILSIASVCVYTKVMYRFLPVYFLLLGAAAVCVLRVGISVKLPGVASYLPIASATLMAAAAIFGSLLMVNQLGYVFSGLDGIDTVMTYVIFMVLSIVGMLLSIIASFARTGKE